MRPSRPFSFIRTFTVGFGIAPNLLTLPLGEEGARGLGLSHPYRPYRRWGVSPRPENIYPPGMSGFWNYGQWRPCQQGIAHGESAYPHAARARLEAARCAVEASQTRLARREFSAPASQAANPIPVCSHINNYDARRAVDERRFACGWTPGAVARIPQITSLDPGKLEVTTQGDCSRQRRVRQARIGLRRAYHRIWI